MFSKFPFIFFVYTLKNVLKDCNTILDLGCGDSSPLRFVTAMLYGVDINRRLIAKAKKERTHQNFKVMDARKIRDHFAPRSFDAVVALDFIEHLTKKEGLMLIKDMEFIASKKVVIFTPNGFRHQKDKNHFGDHLSGWKPWEMRRMGLP